MQKTVAAPLRGMIHTVMAGLVILDVVAYTAEVEFLCKIQMTRKRRNELQGVMAATDESR